MIFRSEKFAAHWDTWMYHHDGTDYLYYLITEFSPGEGIGLATSADGVHYEDHGMIIEASADMVVFLGTGSVWKDPLFEENSRFLINYSEWRSDEQGRPVQNILFAHSQDLVHWEKFGDGEMFKIDPEFYEPHGRWDCINTYPKDGGGYWGSWTATPRGGDIHHGIGMGYSDDGLHWKALPPPEVAPEVHEAGDFHKFGNTYYAMFGRKGSMAVYTSSAPTGPYGEQPKNPQVLSRPHTYFARFYSRGEELLVNHHVMDGQINKDPRGDRVITYAAPLKKVTVDSEGILRLVYWPGNEVLKGRAVGLVPFEATEDLCFAGAPVDFTTGIYLEGTIDLTGGGALYLQIDSHGYGIVVNDSGCVSFRKVSPFIDEIVETHRADRQRPFPQRSSFRFLARRGIAEFYLDGELAECWRMECPTARKIRPGVIGQGVSIDRIFEMSL